MGLRLDACRISALAAVALLLLAAMPSAGVMQDICSGTSTGAGIIPQTPVIGTGGTGVTSVVGLTVIVILSVVLVMAALYMVSKVANLPSLENLVKVEFAEMAGTGIIIAIFFGAFFTAALAGAAGTTTTNPTLHFNGPGRSVFVNDCMMIGNESIGMVLPIMASGTVNFVINLVDSATIKITPGGFGFTVSPLSGLSMITATMTELGEIVTLFLMALLAINLALGLIYGLFPIFLYLGIVFRALPWTRAAGGIFIAMFIGFYVVFPLMLNATIGGFSAASYNSVTAYYSSDAANGIAAFTSNTAVVNIGTIGQQAGLLSSASGALTFSGNVLRSMAGYPNGYGVINGYIADFMGPPIMVIIEIAFSFIVALDFADILSDILGAPSLSTERLLGRML